MPKETPELAEYNPGPLSSAGDLTIAVQELAAKLNELIRVVNDLTDTTRD